MNELVLERRAQVRRGLLLSWATLGYNSLEAGLALSAAAMAGSVALVGFGADSTIEVAAAAVALWRLHADADPARRAYAERVSLRLIGASFLLLAAYVTFESVRMLWLRHTPDYSLLGIVVAAGSVLVMPLLARAKRKVALAMSSSALHYEANQTMLCTFLSAILLGGCCCTRCSAGGGQIHSPRLSWRRSSRARDGMLSVVGRAHAACTRELAQHRRVGVRARRSTGGSGDARWCRARST